MISNCSTHILIVIEKKVKLSVLGFSFNQTQSGTYGLVLAEEGGIRRIMVVVGTPEAQSIAFKLQNAEPPRPLTHDLFQTFIDKFEISLQEVIIYKYDNGVFYSQLLFKQGEKEVAIESRTSDAIGIALRTNAPIYTTEEIMQELAIAVSEDDEDDELDQEMIGGNDSTEYIDNYAELNEEELATMLKDAINHEDYELASVIRDELEKRIKARFDK